MQQMLSAGCAAGIAANLGTLIGLTLFIIEIGAPIGGVLFSIEVTSTYYPMRNYWFSYLTAITGALTFRWLWNLKYNERTLDK